jgi:acetylglutamate kinase
MKSRLLIIKIGGNIIDDEEALASFLKVFASIEDKKILVHGGGKLATRMAEQLNIPQQVVDGRRITDAETLKIVTMVYAGYINKNIVARLQADHCNALGLCGADGNAILAHKRQNNSPPGGGDGSYYGFAGDVDAVNVELINTLLQKNITPVFAPITHDQRGQLLNTNADTIAQELGKGLSGDFEVILIYLFEKAGVLMNPNDDTTVIPHLTRGLYQELRSPLRGGDGAKISAGMIPKLDNAFSALAYGVSRVIIGKAENLNDLIKGNSGTTIIDE